MLSLPHPPIRGRKATLGPSRRALRALLRMTFFLMASTNLRHSGEPCAARRLEGRLLLIQRDLCPVTSIASNAPAARRRGRPARGGRSYWYRQAAFRRETT